MPPNLENLRAARLRYYEASTSASIPNIKPEPDIVYIGTFPSADITPKLDQLAIKHEEKPSEPAITATPSPTPLLAPPLQPAVPNINIPTPAQFQRYLAVHVNPDWHAAYESIYYAQHDPTEYYSKPVFDPDYFPPKNISPQPYRFMPIRDPVAHQHRFYPAENYEYQLADHHPVNDSDDDQSVEL